jgi:hypothetical protein
MDYLSTLVRQVSARYPDVENDLTFILQKSSENSFVQAILTKELEKILQNNDIKSLDGLKKGIQNIRKLLGDKK